MGTGPWRYSRSGAAGFARLSREISFLRTLAVICACIGLTVQGSAHAASVPQTGAIMIDHGPIPAANWPAMRMAFKADEDLRAEVEPGVGVFDLKLANATGKITRINRKQ